MTLFSIHLVPCFHHTKVSRLNRLLVIHKRGYVYLGVLYDGFIYHLIGTDLYYDNEINDEGGQDLVHNVT